MNPPRFVPFVSGKMTCVRRKRVVTRRGESDRRSSKLRRLLPTGGNMRHEIRRDTRGPRLQRAQFASILSKLYK